MRVATYLLGAVCALFTLSAAAQTPSAADVAQARAQAAQAATQLRNLSVNRDAEGNPILNADGSAQIVPKSSATNAATLDYLKTVTGLDGLEQVANPGNKQQAGIAVVSTTGKFDLDCRGGVAGQVRSAGGLTFEATACLGTPVQTLSFKVCDNQMRLGQCSADTDFTQQVNVPVGSFTTVSGVQVGAGCNSTDTCRVSVKGSEAIGGNDAMLRANAAERSSNSTMVKDLQKNVENGSYAQATREMGETIRSNQNQSSQGGTETKLTQSDAQCSGARSCLKWGTTSQTFATSCTRTFPLTERVTKYQLDTAMCEMALVTDKDGNATTTNSCLAADGSDARAEKSKVGETAQSCEASADGGNSCKWTEYFATTDPKVLAVSDSPSPVAGACDTNPNSTTSFTKYFDEDGKGEWFGRTLAPEECLVNGTVDGTGQATGTLFQLTYREKAGCGIYTRPSTGVVCYGQPSATDDVDSCGSIDTNACRLTSATPASYTGINSGLVMSQKETYECAQSQNICLEWSNSSQDNACLNNADMTFGNKQDTSQTVDVNKMNAALVAAAIATAAGEEQDDMGDEPQKLPKVFSGKDMRCTRATGGIGQLFGRNCCRMDMERPVSGQAIRDGCEMPAVELAAARRSKYTVYIGEYCSNRSKWPLKKCLEQTQTYCSFNGILPRIIHEQGRQQLLEMATSSAGAQTVTQQLRFDYLQSGDGGWTAPVDVNGVKVAAWQWPNYCADPAKAAEVQGERPTAFECPGIVKTVIASCDNTSGCGDLPVAPEYGPNRWNLVEVDPLLNESRAVSQYAAVKGACSPETAKCSYDATSWPAGQGGKAIVTRTLSWHLYSKEQTGERAAGGVNQMTNISDLMFRTWSESGASDGKTVPDTVRIDFSQDGGQSWSTVRVPTDLKGKEYTFPGSDTRLSGRCDALTNLCSFRVTSTSTVVMKPWGIPQMPDCTGFTAGQLSAMDFGKMDLSEWLATVMDKVASAASPTELAKTANEQFQEFNRQFSGGTVTTTAPTAAHYARISPSQGFGPFQTRLIASGFWPETTGDAAKDIDRVTAVEVDWGDCTGKEQMQLLSNAQPGSGYFAYHVFKAPNELACGARNANVTQQVTMTVHTTKSGIQTRTVTVENAYNKFPGGSGGRNDNVPVQVTAPVNQGTNPAQR